jgi:hypothetical protein
MLVSSTYLFHLDGFRGYDSTSIFSNFFMKILATIEYKGDPMATPLIFSKKSP